MNRQFRASSESGQTLIIVLLVVLVSLAVGVGVATRSTSTVQQTTFSEEATQALHFAEACAEEALGKIKIGDSAPGGITTSDLPCGDLDYADDDTCPPLDVDDDGSNDCCYEVSSLSEIFPGVISQDDVAEAKLGGFSGNIDVYWCDSASSSQECGDPEGSNPPALELVLVKDDAVERLAYAHPASARGDNFSSGEIFGEEVNGVTFAYKISIAIDEVNALRVIPRYNDSSVAVIAGGLPHQGYKITAKGDFGRSMRMVEVTKTEPAMPAIFDYVLFSGSETEPLEKR